MNAKFNDLVEFISKKTRNCEFLCNFFYVKKVFIILKYSIKALNFNCFQYDQYNINIFYASETG